MSTTPLAPLALVLGMLLTAGCAADDPAGEERSSAGARGEPGGTGAAAAAPAPEPARARSAGTDRRVVVPRASASSGPSVALRPFSASDAGPLLAGRDLGPGWTVSGTAAERGRVVSDCQRAPLVDIGALSSRIRVLSGPTASARQGLSRFADRRSAWRAEQVLATWREDCAAALARRGAALGTVRHRERLSVVEVEGVPRPARTLVRLLDRVMGGLR